MQLGHWQLDTVSGGTLRLDGGAMFGVVPKPLWERYQPADEKNRIRSGTNCVLARDGRRTVLIDTGYGGKESDKARQVASLEAGEPLLASLAALGVRPEQIDLVVFSHLHFDHAGGGVRRREDGTLVPTFPHARYCVQQGEWEIAGADLPELRGSYPPEHLLPLADSGQLELLHGDQEILPGLRVQVTGGHTEWHQAVVVESGSATAIYLGDLCPMEAHIPSHWGMGYDLYPLVTRRVKPRLLAEAAAHDWLVLWDHDPDHAAARLQPDPKRDFTPRERFARL